MRTFGADVSHWEGDVDWIKGVDYLPFVYYKATDGEDFIDSQLGNNMDECNDVGMPHAPYHWWQETQNPIAQAEHFWDTVKDGGYKRLIVDVEPKVILPDAYNRLLQLLSRLEAMSGIVPAIYTSANYWNNYVRVPYNNKYPLLVAQYKYGLNPILPSGATSWKIWQFTDLFWFSGCNATADGNWFNGTLEECRSWFGNYRPFLPQPVGGKTQMVVTADVLNIRYGPSTNFSIVGALHKNDVINVIDVAGQDAWVRHELGWSCVKVGSYIYLVPK